MSLKPNDWWSPLSYTIITLVNANTEINSPTYKVFLSGSSPSGLPIGFIVHYIHTFIANWINFN